MSDLVAAALFTLSLCFVMAAGGVIGYNYCKSESEQVDPFLVVIGVIVALMVGLLFQYEIAAYIAENPQIIAR